MTSILELVDDPTHNGASWSVGSHAIVLTGKNPSFQFGVSNPIAIIPPPTPPAPSEHAWENSNAVAINIGMMYPTVSITFTDLQGIPEDPFNLTGVSAQTVFGKMYYMAVIDKYRKLLFVNTLDNPLFVQITDWKCNVAPGHKDILTHSVIMAIVGALSM